MEILQARFLSSFALERERRTDGRKKLERERRTFPKVPALSLSLSVYLLYPHIRFFSGRTGSLSSHLQSGDSIPISSDYREQKKLVEYRLAVIIRFARSYVYKFVIKRIESRRNNERLNSRVKGL